MKDFKKNLMKAFQLYGENLMKWENL